MCGITALFKRRDLARPLSLAQEMSDRVAHRGPDGTGLVGLDGAAVTRAAESTAWQVALAHRRLSIIDLTAAAAQPMVYRDRYWLIYNGEVYNYLELRAELERLGRTFRTEGDAEVVLAAFAEWGAECFERMRGMWSLVLVDAHRGDASSVETDWESSRCTSGEATGCSPWSPRSSSSWPSLASAPGARNRRWPSSSRPGTKIRRAASSARSLHSPRARIARCASTRRSLSPPEPYWWPERVDAVGVGSGRGRRGVRREARRLRAPASAQRRTGGVFAERRPGLQRHRIARQPSGEAGATDLSTFTSTCVGDPADELEYVDAVLDRIRGMPHLVTPSPQGFLDDLDEFVCHHDEPVGSLSMYAGYCVARMTRAAAVPVVLSGQGGDEILSGYWQSYFIYLRELGLGGHVPALARHLVGALLPDGNPTLLRQAPVMVRRYSARRKGISVIDGQSAAGSDVLGRMLASRGQERRLNEIRIMYLPRLLKWDDRNSMAFGVESRYPFLDHGLIELCLSFAPEVLYRHGWTKWPLRQGLRGLLPEKVARRRSKFGYWVPQDRWLCDSLRPALTEWLDSDRPLWDSLDRTAVRKLAEQTWQLAGRRDETGQALVRCFLLDRWLEVFDVQ